MPKVVLFCPHATIGGVTQVTQVNWDLISNKETSLWDEAKN